MMTNIMVHAVVCEEKLSAANAAAIWANGRTSFCSETHKFVRVNQQNENLSEDNFPPQVSKHQSHKEEAKMYKCESFFVWVMFDSNTTAPSGSVLLCLLKQIALQHKRKMLTCLKYTDPLPDERCFLLSSTEQETAQKVSYKNKHELPSFWEAIYMLQFSFELPPN